MYVILFPCWNIKIIHINNRGPWTLHSNYYKDSPRLDLLCCGLIETFRNATLALTVTVRGARRLWRLGIVCIWNAPNRRPNRKCHHMKVSGADNRTRFTVSGYAKFHQIFRGKDITWLNKLKLMISRTMITDHLWGNPSSAVNSLHKRPVMWSFDASFDLCPR